MASCRSSCVLASYSNASNATSTRGAYLFIVHRDRWRLDDLYQVKKKSIQCWCKQRKAERRSGSEAERVERLNVDSHRVGVDRRLHLLRGKQ